MITVKLGVDTDLLFWATFVSGDRSEIANISHDFNGARFSHGDQGMTIEDAYFRGFYFRPDEDRADAIAVSMNDVEANNLINWLREHEFYLVDATEDVTASWDQGKPIDVTQEKLLDEW